LYKKLQSHDLKSANKGVYKSIPILSNLKRSRNFSS
jgi:hypothetical protein